MTHLWRNIEMLQKNGYRIFSQSLFTIILLAGIALRLAEWLHHRDLMMDEVNVVRNIFERNYIGLFEPLNYEQFAPPLFLSIIKLTASFFGYGELSLRLFPILCSILSLVLIYKVAIAFNCKRSFWYPMALFAFSEIYIQYANDVKQYSSDTLIALFLAFVASSDQPLSKPPLRFFLFWSLLGAVFIWLSMPVVFILAGVGITLFLRAVKEKASRYYLPIIGTGCLWLCSFLIYYFVLLKQQIHSEYLQNFHAPYFLNFTSWKDIIDNHNLDLLNTFFAATTGSNKTFPLVLNFALLLLGILTLLRKDRFKGLILLLPVVLFLLAVGFHSFTLLPRVGIFVMPFLLLLAGIGLESAISHTYKLKWVVVAACIVSIGYAQQFRLFKDRIEIDEFTTGVKFARKNNVPFNQIYFSELYKPVLIYYTQIHPDKSRAQSYDSIQILRWDASYQTIRENIKDRSAFIYFWMDDRTMQTHRDSIFSYFHPVDSLIKPSYKALVYER